MSCPYCLETFNIYSKLPITLACSHTYCQECVTLLSEIMRYCPLDKTLVSFDSKNINEEIRDKLNFLCNNHRIEISGVCESHSEFFCPLCKPKHKKCKVLIGSYEKIKTHLKNTIDEAFNKSLQISENINKGQLVEFEDGVVWVDEYLKKINEALQEIEFSKKNNFSIESKTKILEKYRNLEGILKNELDDKQEENPFALTLPSDPGPNNPSNSLLKFDSTQIKFNQNDIIENFMKLINSPDEIVNEIIRQIEPGTIFYYFNKSVINEEEYGNYFCYFIQTCQNSIPVFGFGIGRPSIPNQTIFVSCFEVQLNDTILEKDEFMVEYNENKKIHIHVLKNPILLEPNAELLIHLEIFGSNNYLFKGSHSKNVTTKDVEGKVYSESFPVLFFTC